MWTSVTKPVTPGSNRRPGNKSALLGATPHCYRTDTINPTFFNKSNEITYKGTKEDLWLTNFLQTFQPKPCSYSKHREYSNVTILNQEFKSLAQFCELYGINPNCMDIRRLKIKKPDYSTWTFEEVLDIACPIK